MQRGLEDIARVAARLARPFANREEVLRAAGLDEATWETEKERLREANAKLPPAERLAMARAFRSTFADPDGAARNARASAPSVVVAPAAPTAQPLPPAAPLPTAPPGNVPVREIPSYLRQPVVRAPAIDARPTVMASQLPATARPLPFSPSEHPVAPPPTGPAFQSGFTVAARPLPRKSLPFRRNAAPAAAPPPGWDVERYGRLCIDFIRSGLDESLILQRAGINEEQRRALDRYWEDRMFAEPELRLVWRSACDRRVAEIERGLV